MNPIIASYFHAIEMRLIESPVVASYKQVRREVTPHHLHTKDGPPQPIFDVPNAMTALTTIEKQVLV